MKTISMLATLGKLIIHKEMDKVLEPVIWKNEKHKGNRLSWVILFNREGNKNVRKKISLLVSKQLRL